MNPFPLLNGNTQQVVAHACGECGTVHSPKSYCGTSESTMAMALSRAELCCTPRVCAGCKVELPRPDYYLKCDECRRLEESWKELERVARAERISLDEYDEDWVFIDDNFTAVDSLEEGELEGVTIWAAARDVLKLDARDILESETADWHEDAWQDLDAESLQKLLDGWVAEQTVNSWHIRNDLIVNVGGGK